MTLKFTKGQPTVHGLYAFSPDCKTPYFYKEINSKNQNIIHARFFCYLGPIPVIEPAENLKRIFIKEILEKLIDRMPIIVKSKESGKVVDTIVPFSIAKENGEIFINNKYGNLSYDFWEKDE